MPSDPSAIWRNSRTRGKAGTGTGAACHVRHMAPSQVLPGAFGLEQAGNLYFWRFLVTLKKTRNMKHIGKSERWCENCNIL